jgi:hypothetical protein
LRKNGFSGLQGLKPLKKTELFVVAEATTHKDSEFFRNLFSRDIRSAQSARLYRLRKNAPDCHSERSEESLFVWCPRKERFLGAQRASE